MALPIKIMRGLYCAKCDWVTHSDGNHSHIYTPTPCPKCNQQFSKIYHFQNKYSNNELKKLQIINSYCLDGKNYKIFIDKENCVVGKLVEGIELEYGFWYRWDCAISIKTITEEYIALLSQCKDNGLDKHVKSLNMLFNHLNSIKNEPSAQPSSQPSSLIKNNEMTG